jgi:hypothetical protein
MMTHRRLTKEASGALPILAAVMLLGTDPGAAADVSAIELRRLFEPSGAELAEEARGRIHIYEGLRDTDVQRALDEAFDRVENMMFIRTIKTDDRGEVQRDPDSGAVEIEDDGC